MIVSAQTLSKHYVEVPSNILTEGEQCSFDVYLKMNDDFVLFSSKELTISQEHIKIIRSSQFQSVFVKKSDEDAYLDYLAEHLSKLTSNEELAREEKARFMYDSAKTAMEKLFSNPDTPESISGVKDVSDNIIDTLLSDDRAFASLVKMSSYDYYTYTHSVNVVVYSLGLGKRLGMSGQELKNLGYGAALHDIGKSKIPNEIINKPGKLTEEEFAIIKSHPPLGEEHLKGLGEMNRDILDAVNHHHEKLDGTGYPYKLKGNDVPLFARIVAIADIFDALNSKRSYKDAMSSFETLQFMKANMAAHVDTKLLTSFILCMSGK